MAIAVDPNEIIKLVKFFDKHGVSNPDDYRFTINPSFRILNLRVEVEVTYLPVPETITIVLDP